MKNDFVRGKDLEERMMRFSKCIREFVRQLPKTISNIEDVKQLVRSSGSVGANYIEANESLGKKDFLMRVKTARKECKEALYWLELLYLGESLAVKSEHQRLLKEAQELRLILSSIILKCSK